MQEYDSDQQDRSAGSRDMERFDFTSYAMMLCGKSGTAADCRTSVSKTLFDPSTGLAYRLAPSFIARDGGVDAWHFIFTARLCFHFGLISGESNLRGPQLGAVP